jgi:hypothetical protein
LKSEAHPRSISRSRSPIRSDVHQFDRSPRSPRPPTSSSTRIRERDSVLVQPARATIIGDGVHFHMTDLFTSMSLLHTRNVLKAAIESYVDYHSKHCAHCTVRFDSNSYDVIDVIKHIGICEDVENANYFQLQFSTLSSNLKPKHYKRQYYSDILFQLWTQSENAIDKYSNHVTDPNNVNVYYSLLNLEIFRSAARAYAQSTSTCTAAGDLPEYEPNDFARFLIRFINAKYKHRDHRVQMVDQTGFVHKPQQLF